MKKILIFSAMVVLACWGLLPQQNENIHTAARNGDLEAVKALIKKQPQLIKTRDGDGRTALHWASRGQNRELLLFLIEQGADVNAQDNNQVAPLHSMAVRDQTEAAALLLDNGADINILDFEKHTPLHLAAMSGRSKAVALLVERGADLEIKDDYGRTPLLLCARERGGPEVTRILIKGGADVNARDRSGATPLSLASWRGYTDVVDILLRSGAALPKKGIAQRRLLLNSTGKGLTTLFQKLTETGADLLINFNDGSSLLHSAAKGGSAEIVETLIRKNLKINQPDRFGWTPLHYAARDGRTAAVEKLLEYEAALNLRNLSGQTAFNVAEENRQKEITDLLTKKGADTGPTLFPELKGDYLGQPPPGTTPNIFALGIVSSIWGLHSTIAFSPDGNEAYWAPMVEIPGQPYSRGIIYGVKRINQVWTPPFIAPFSGKFDDDVPFFAPDGQKLYFSSSRPIPGVSNSRKERIWTMEKTDGQWSDPQPAAEAVNRYDIHWQFSVDKSGTIYFGSGSGGGFGMSDIYRTVCVEGEYQEAENLGPKINTENLEHCPFISPDGSYLIFARSENLWITFLQEDQEWSNPINLRSILNTGGICPIISADGKYLFYNSRHEGEISAYWIDAGFIKQLKAASRKKDSR